MVTVQGTRVIGTRRVRGQRITMGKQWYHYPTPWHRQHGHRDHYCFLHRGGKKVKAYFDKDHGAWVIRGRWKKA